MLLKGLASLEGNTKFLYQKRGKNGQLRLGQTDYISKEKNKNKNTIFSVVLIGFRTNQFKSVEYIFVNGWGNESTRQKPWPNKE